MSRPTLKLPRKSDANSAGGDAPSATGSRLPIRGGSRPGKPSKEALAAKSRAGESGGSTQPKRGDKPGYGASPHRGRPQSPNRREDGASSGEYSRFRDGAPRFSRDGERAERPQRPQRPEFTRSDDARPQRSDAPRRPSNNSNAQGERSERNARRDDGWRSRRDDAPRSDRGYQERNDQDRGERRFRDSDGPRRDRMERPDSGRDFRNSDRRDAPRDRSFDRADSRSYDRSDDRPNFRGGPRSDSYSNSRANSRSDSRPEFRSEFRSEARREGRPSLGSDARFNDRFNNDRSRASSGNAGRYSEEGQNRREPRAYSDRGDRSEGRGYRDESASAADRSWKKPNPNFERRREAYTGGDEPRFTPRNDRRDARREPGREPPRDSGREGGFAPRRDDSRPNVRKPAFNQDRKPSFAERERQPLPARLPDVEASSTEPAMPAKPRPEFPRLSKVMSERGLCSRREADEWIENGWVKVDGRTVAELGSRVSPNVDITIDQAAQKHQSETVTVLLNKPIGFVSGQAEDGYQPASVLIRPENRWEEDQNPTQFKPGHLRGLAPAGRLDIDSTGLLVLTQDGRIARRLVGDDSTIEKEYLVRVEGQLMADGLALLNHGLSLDGVKLKPAQVSWQNEDQLRFVLREGRKRQIRRMCELVGLKVVGLKRIRIGSVVLGKLPVGAWRYLRMDEKF